MPLKMEMCTKETLSVNNLTEKESTVSKMDLNIKGNSIREFFMVLAN